jgi:hypothetical protein
MLLSIAGDYAAFHGLDYGLEQGLLGHLPPSGLSNSFIAAGC